MGFPVPLVHAYAIEGAGKSPCPAAPNALDAIKRQFRKWSDASKSRRDFPKTIPAPVALAQNRASFIGINAERAQFAVQRRAFHADKFGRTRDVAAEAVDLGEQIFALENLSRVAQGKRHQMLPPCPVRRQ